MAELNSTHQLRVFSNVFTDEPCEAYDIPHGVILGEWLRDNIDGFNPDEVQLSYSLPFDCAVAADVSCYFVPQKGAIKSVTKVFKKALSIGLFGLLLRQSKPKTPGVNSQESGDGMEFASSTEQTNRYGQPVREAFGRNKIVLDYLVPPRRFFASKKEHRMESLLCLGVGDFQANNDDVKISNTNLNLVSGSSSTLYAPNALLSGDTRTHWWHTSKEVGPTSQGSTGLKLETGGQAQRAANGGNYLFSGKTITAMSGQVWPETWSVGTVLDVAITRQYVYRQERFSIGLYYGSLIGNFSGLDLTTGGTVTTKGDVSGTFQPMSYRAPVVSTTGSPSVWLAGGAPSLSYSLSPANFIVNCGRATANIILDEDYSSQSDLVAALNDKISLSAISGLCEFSSGLKITELQNYTATSISVQNINNSAEVFGDLSLASFTRGTARTESKPAELTLRNLIARPTVNISITKANTRYLITNVSPSSINVELMDGNGAQVPWGGWEDDVLSNNPSISINENYLQTPWRGPFAATPASERCTQLQYDILFPQGLNIRDDNGNPHPRSCGSVLRYRESGSGSWTQVVHRYNESEIDQIGFTHTISLPRPMVISEVQVRRESAESTDSKITESMEWFGLKAKMERQVSRYPSFTTLAVRVSGAAIAAQADSEVSVVATRKLNGVATRNIKDAVEYIARTTEIDSAELARLSAIWAARGDSFDMQFNTDTTVAKAVNNALSVGFSELTIKQGLLTPVRDAKRAPELLQAFNHTYSAQNTTAPIVEQASWPDDDDPDGYDVEYIDEISWRVETVKCRLPSSTERKIEKIKADGITNRRKAYQWGMRQLMTALTESVSYSTSTELDARNNWYGDYVNFVQEIPDWSQTALVHGISSDKLIIESSEPLNWEGSAHSIALQRPNGTMSEIKAATRIDDYTVSISSPFSFTPRVMESVIVFGQTERLTNPAIVRSVVPSGDKTKISGIAYNEQKYLYDDAALPPGA